MIYSLTLQSKQPPAPAGRLANLNDQGGTPLFCQERKVYDAFIAFDMSVW